jgi:hypothetical protein
VQLDLDSKNLGWRHKRSDTVREIKLVGLLVFYPLLSLQQTAQSHLLFHFCIQKAKDLPE